MKKYLRPVCAGLALLLLLCGLGPLFFGVWNAGAAAALLYGGALFAVIMLWNAFPAPLPGVPVIRCYGFQTLKRPRPPARWWRITRLCACAVLALSAACGIVLSAFMLHAAYLSPPDDTPHTVVILGCQVHGDQPSVMLRNRLEAALSYLKTHPDAPVVTSGGLNDGGTHSEAAVMQLYLISRGVRPEQIYLEERSRNTQENIQFSKQIIDSNGLPTGIAIATDGFHQMRAAFYARRYGAQASALPAVTPWGLLPTYWIREFLGLMKAFVV